MRTRRLIVPLVAILSLVLAACGGDDDAGGDATDDPTGEESTSEAMEEETSETSEPAEGDTVTAAAAELDCPAVEVIVPYSPGGGSDQQVRRLQPALEEALGKRLNITYQTGGDGSVGWNALAGAAPDGCTIANVVAPNIMNLSINSAEEIGFTAEDFEYIAWTEYSPNILGVATDSEFENLEDFITEAEAAPGELTISGVGINGELLASEVLQATGIELSFVPVSGGVGDIIPQIAGGHIDSAISGFSLLDGDQVRPLALSAPSAQFPDVTTFEEAGYEGVTLVTSWGFILPPETPAEIVETWNAAVQEAMATEEVQAAYEEAGFEVLDQDVEEARQYFEEQFAATQKALEGMEG